MKRHILHRRGRLALVVACAVLLLAPPGARGQRGRKTSSGPRALGVVVFSPQAGAAQAGGKTKSPANPAGARLIPVTIWYEQRFYDASVYKATPRPLALDPDVVYEVQQAGESLGLFTVGAATRQDDEAWIADGRYRTNAEIEASAAARRKPAYVPPANDTDEPPKLRRAPASASGAPAPKTGQPPTTEAPKDAPRGDGDGPPRLKRPPAEPQPGSAPAPSTQTSSASPAGAPASPPRDPSPDSDPDRPKLRRGAVPQTVAPTVAAPKPQPPAAGTIAGPAGAISGMNAAPAPRVVVAISDADGPEARPYIFHWSADEQARLTRAAVQRANDEIARYAAAHYGLRPETPAAAATLPRGRTRAPAAPKATPSAEPLDEMQVRAVDLDYSNYPEIVLTGRRTVRTDKAAPGTPAERTYYVALVLWADLRVSGAAEQYRTFLAYVTDDAHLDQSPRLQFIDAVDADGDGIGELLFRATYGPRDEQDPSRWSFQLYRTGPDKLRKVYDSAGGTD